MEDQVLHTNYFEVLDQIAETGRQVIMYDQIGCGNSFVEGYPELFNADTWIKELIELRKHLGLEEIHLLGQSWGGMQAIWYAIEYKPKGIKSYISFVYVFLLQNCGKKNKKEEFHI